MPQEDLIQRIILAASAYTHIEPQHITPETTLRELGITEVCEGIRFEQALAEFGRVGLLTSVSKLADIARKIQKSR